MYINSYTYSKHLTIYDFEFTIDNFPVTSVCRQITVNSSFLHRPQKSTTIVQSMSLVLRDSLMSKSNEKLKVEGRTGERIFVVSDQINSY